jgi:hypothetical protein
MSTGAASVAAAPPSVEVCDLGWVNTAIGNINNALHGTYHPARAKKPQKLYCYCPQGRSAERGLPIHDQSFRS